MDSVTVKFLKVDPDAVIPTQGSSFAVGYDFYSIEEVNIPPGGIIAVKTGLIMEMPNNVEMEIRPRSGISCNYPSYIANSPGTVDPDYRGEIKILVINHTGRNCHINKHDRIAQGVFKPVIRPKIVETDALRITERGSDGFGSTGR